MENGWEENYYLKQAGSGFTPYSGLRYQRGNGFRRYAGSRYQRGNGFLGRIWKGVTLPLLKYIGRHGIEAAGNIVKEVGRNPEELANVVKKEARRLAGQAANDGGKRLSRYIQTGEGIKRTRVAPPKVNKKLIKGTAAKKTNKTTANKRLSSQSNKLLKKNTLGKLTSKKTSATPRCRVPKMKKAKSFLSHE